MEKYENLNMDDLLHEKLTSCNKNISNSYKSYFEELVSLYQSIQHILLISLNDVFLKTNLNSLLMDELIKDTIDIIVKHENDLNKILKTQEKFSQCSENETLNKFLMYSKKCEELLSSKLIEYPFSENKTESAIPIPIPIDNHSSFKKGKNIPKKHKSKKNYEVEKLSQYMLDIIEKENLKNLIEMGCGKSYLTDSILLSDDMVYIGLDRKDDLIDKSTKSNKKKNLFVLNHDITLENFSEIFEKEIESKLNKSIDEKKIMLFGLHSCGNLTSDTIKIFFQRKEFTHIVIVGCCLNLLKEYVSEEVQNKSEIFKEYLANIGYDNKGNFLEQTLLYEYDYAKVGFPLSEYILKKHKGLFLTRTVRNASMQSFPKKEDCLIESKKNLFYKKIFFRTLLQSFLEEFFVELKNVYGFGKIDITTDDDFGRYLNIVFKNLHKLIKNNSNKEKLQIENENLLKKLNDLQSILFEENFDCIKSSVLLEYVKKFEELENVLWAVYVIRLKFAKIIEYIIALDRIIFMQERGISNVHLVNIFDESVSVRNILIYATK
jgi:hypothetical protein